MNLYSLTFLFLFLPLFGLVYYIAPPRLRVPALFAATVIFALSFGIEAVSLMLVSVYADFLLARPICRGGKGAAVAVYAGAVKDIGLFVTLSAMNELSMTVLPIGVAVYCFTSLGYLVDLHHGEADLIENPLDYFIFCCFFGKINVGPIVSAGQFLPQLRRLHPTMELAGQGARWYIHGLAKYVLLAQNISALAAEFAAIPYASKTVLSVWLLVICNLLAVYFTLSGFSDMARGLGAIFGLDLPENFHYPLQSDSVTDFFSRFNISANRFVRKYVYAALGAEDNGPISTTLNIMLITMLMGIWYGVRINLLVWGASLGVFIVIETMAGDRFLPRLPGWLRQIYAFAAVLLSFSWYCGHGLSQSWFYLTAMLGGAGLAPVNDVCRYLLSSNWLLLLCGVLFCTRIVHTLFGRLAARRPVLSTTLMTVCNTALLVVTTAFLV